MISEYARALLSFGKMRDFGMTNYFKTDSLHRAFIAGAAALTLAACGGGETGTSNSGSTAEDANSQEYADAGFMIALCAPEENYFKNISFQFERYQTIMKMGQQGKARDAYIGIAKSAGLSEDDPRRNRRCNPPYPRRAYSRPQRRRS